MAQNALDSVCGYGRAKKQLVRNRSLEGEVLIVTLTRRKPGRETSDCHGRARLGRVLGEHPRSHFICINAPKGCQHGTHTNGTAYTRGTYSRVHI